MIKRKLFALSAPVVASLLFATLLLAQSSANFDLQWHALTSGGGQRVSANFVLQDALGETTSGASTSANTLVQAGFVAGLGVAPTNTPEPQAGGDSFEDDDVCGRAKPLLTTGGKQMHTFHDLGERDWISFTVQAGRTYLIDVNNLSPKSDAVLTLFDACNVSPSGSGNNSFGSTVHLEWDSTKNGIYFLEIQQFDPSFFGEDVNYEIAITPDNTPPSAPRNLRCLTVDSATLGTQWQKSPERDVRGYRIAFQGNVSGSEDVDGANTTFAQIAGLTASQTYAMRARAVDYSGNESQPSGEVQCTVTTPVDTTQPALSVQQPGSSNTVSTTSNLLTFTGLATDSGGNLSRVRLHNATTNATGWDYSLSGNSDDFRVPDVGMAFGNNSLEVEAIDSAGNSSKQTITVRRLGNSPGAVILIAGRNETNGLQNNIYNSVNRAYRIFKSGGFSDETIFYIAPTGQDADNDGDNDVDAQPGNPAAVQNAVLTWAKQGGKVGAGKPLFVYMMDHGFEEKFCVDGCNSPGFISPADLDGWLRTLETDTGLDQVSIVIEACRSGSFIDRFNGDVVNSLSKQGRVVITSTSRDKNAYASAQGAYFSDAFFSCVADSNDLRTCFNQGKQAVTTTGVSQEPWLDDNGDGIADANDGSVAQTRVVTRFFSSIRPEIASVNIEQQGANGTLSAMVLDGAEETEVVWAAIYPPGFQEPADVTLNLNIPTVRLEPDANTPHRYSFNYINGFTQEGDYRVVFYAQDRLGINAIPRRFGEQNLVYLPVIWKP